MVKGNLSYLYRSVLMVIGLHATIAFAINDSFDDSEFDFTEDPNVIEHTYHPHTLPEAADIQILNENPEPEKIQEPLLAHRYIPFVIGVSAGPVWGKGGETQSLYLTPEIEKTYTANRMTNIIADGDLFLGLQKQLPYALQGQLGLAIVTTSNTTISGDIWDDANSLFNNHSYEYAIRHTHVALKGKLLLDRGCRLIPWISGGLGIGWNFASGFTNTSTLYEALPDPNFTNNTTTAFTYTVGAGVQRHLTEHVQVGMGYEFANWGPSHLNAATGQTVGQGPSLSHYYTNGFLINLTYLT